MLEDILKHGKFKRYANREVEVVDVRNVLAVKADLFGWQKEYNEAVNGKIEERIDENTVKVTDFAEVIESFVLVDDKTKFRPYFSILAAIKNIQDAGGFRLTPEVISAYTNINVTDVRSNLHMLVKEGYVRKRLVRQTPEWQELSQKIRKEKGYDAKVKRLEEKKHSEVDKQKEKSGKELKKLQEKITKFEKMQAELQMPVTDEGKKHLVILRENIENHKLANISEIEKKYLQKINDASANLSKEEKNLWRVTERGKHMPFYYYDISERGCGFIKLINQKYPKAFEEANKLFKQVREHISSKDIVDLNLDILHLYHIPKELLNKHVELAFFREKLLDWNQLMIDERTTLCDIMVGEFNITKNGKPGRYELVYATGLQEKDNIYFMARIYIDKDGIVWAQPKAKHKHPYRIGTDMKHEIFYAFKKNSDTLRIFTKGRLTSEYCSILKKAIQDDEIQLAETDEEKQNCKNVSILGTNSMINVYDAAGTSAFILRDSTRIEIPKGYENTLFFLPQRIWTSVRRGN